MKPLVKLVVLVALSGVWASGQTDDLAAKSRRGKDLMASGKFEEAIPIYRELVRALPDHPGPVMDLGLALHMAGHESEAVTQFKTVLKLDAKHLPAQLFLGAAYLGLKEPAKAIGPLRTVVRAQPNNKEARLLLGEALLAVERFRAAAEQFEKLSKLDPANPKVWNGLGLSYEGLANENFDRLERIAPGSAYWLVLVAESREKVDQYNTAFYFYRQALSRMPTMRGVHRAVAEIYVKAGHPDWAKIEEAKERTIQPLECGNDRAAGDGALGNSRNGPSGAKKADPDHPSHALECNFWSGRYRELIAGSEGGKTAEVYFWRTRAYNELARGAFSSLARLPPSAEVHELMATIDFNRKKFATSVKEWQEALRFSPGNSFYRQRLAICQSASGNYEDALPILQDLIQRSADSVELNYWLGFTLLGLERAAEAIPHLEKAVEADPSVLPSQRDLARAYLRVAQVEKAIPHLKAALPIDDDGSLYYQLARAYRSIGKQELAKETLRKFQEVQKSSIREKRTLQAEVQITAP